MPESIRIASLNVKRLGARERPRAARIGAFVRELQSDVVALQEIGEEAAHDVAAHAGMAHVTFVGHALSGRRGVALLHRAPAITSSGVRIAARVGDDKGFTRAVLRFGDRELEIVGMHLDWLSRRARLVQIERIARALGAPSIPRVALGDLNAMTLRTWARGETADETVIALALALGVRTPGKTSPTFPSHAPRWALDWVLASPELGLSEIEVVPTALSDHAAIVAEVG